MGETTRNLPNLTEEIRGSESRGSPLILSPKIDGSTFRSGPGLYPGIYELIFVDFNSSPHIRKLYDGIKLMVDSLFSLRDGKPVGNIETEKEQKILAAVFEILTNKLKNPGIDIDGKADRSDRLTYEYGVARYGAQQVMEIKTILVPLDIFVEHEATVCRHDALITALILEHLKEEGYLKGSIRTTFARSKFVADWGENHMWTEYESNSGQKTVLDVSLEYIGPIENTCYAGVRVKKY